MILVYLFSLTFVVLNTLQAFSRHDYIEAALWAMAFCTVVAFMFYESEAKRGRG